MTCSHADRGSAAAAVACPEPVPIGLSGWSIVRSAGGAGDAFERTWHDAPMSIDADISGSDRFRVSFSGVADFEVDFPAREIRIDGGDASRETIRHLLADQVLPRILAHEGQFVSHAAGVLSPEGLVILLGRTGAGKSTLAASLHASGWPLLGDDAFVLAIDGSSATARAVYRSLRLYPDSITRVLGNDRRVVPVASYTTKQNVIDLDGDLPAEPVLVRASFLLEAAETILVEPLIGGAACMALVEHSFALNPADPGRRRSGLDVASAIAAHVPAFRLGFPRDYSALPAVREAIARSLSPRGPAA